MTYNRESKKNKLKSQVITPENEDKPHKRHISAKIVIAVAACIAAIALFAYLLYNRKFSTFYDVIWEEELFDEGSKADAFREYIPYADGMIRYSKDGASYIDSDGKTIWEKSFQMNSPAADVNGEYAVIADEGGSSIYIFNETGNTGTTTTLLPLTKAVVSQYGVVFAILKDKNAEWISAFKPDGGAIDLSVKSIISGDGYPVDISVSPDGSQLITSYVSIENGVVSNKVIFRNFGEIGKNTDARRIVGGFSDEFQGKLVSRVHFSDEVYSQAFYGGGIVFFSNKVLTSPKVVNSVGYSEEMLSIAYSDKYVAVVLRQESEEAKAPYRLEIFRTDGKLQGTAEFDFQFENMAIQGDEIIFTGKNDVHIYRCNGSIKAELEMDGDDPDTVIKTKIPGEYIAAGGNKLIKFKLR
ncbi:MAG: DUF5711 family protein [Eubacteriales bacterium]|nr:DUF5711 family protein [Eubacteriales bacterium]